MNDDTAVALPREQVVGVSWPRSGHGMLMRLLKLYYGPGFGYCEFYRDDIDCCRQFPCTRQDSVHFTKNHDWDLALPQLPGRKYLIQYRSFLPSVVSNFELHVRGGGPDTPEGFRAFASREFERYDAFMRKWVQSDFARRQLTLNYGAFLQAPETEFARVVAFFTPEQDVNRERIAEAVANVASERVTASNITREAGAGVHQERDVRAFRHYDAALFEMLERLKITRAEVVRAFEQVLGRKPREEAILPHQTYESGDELRTALRASDEYRARHGEAEARPGLLRRLFGARRGRA
jgi:hypothetical protein